MAKLTPLEYFVTFLGLLVLNGEAVANELAHTDLVEDRAGRHRLLFEGQLEDVADETTDLEVGQLLELFWREDVGQEPEDLHVGKFNVILAFLVALVV